MKTLITTTALVAVLGVFSANAGDRLPAADGAEASGMMDKHKAMPAADAMKSGADAAGIAGSTKEASAANLEGRRILSSDGQLVGAVDAFKADPSGDVSAIHFDVGGFLGIGARTVVVASDQFSITDDAILLKLTAKDVETLPELTRK